MPEKGFSEKIRVLTFDVEEWFHILDVGPLADTGIWGSFKARVHEGTRRILKHLDGRGMKATFFVLGWVAKKHPDIVREISARGHEVGTHSMNHILLYRSTPEAFRADLRASIDIIEGITGKKARAYRAPGFSMTKDTLWAYRVMAEEGIEVDSSIFPAPRGHGGIRDFPYDSPFLIRTGKGTIKEFPINVFRLRRLRIPFSGGGYFRLLPYAVINRFIGHSDYLMAYFHPRDFDPGQPVLRGLPPGRRFKGYYGLRGAFGKFEKMTAAHTFGDISAAESAINWSKVPEIEV